MGTYAVFFLKHVIVILRTLTKCYFQRETIYLKNSFFLKNLKFGMLKNHGETLMSSRLTFLNLESFFFNLVSLHTKLLSLKTDKFSICLSRFLQFKKSKIRTLLDKKIVDDTVISDKFLVKTKKSINFYKITAPFHIESSEKTLFLKNIENA